MTDELCSFVEFRLSALIAAPSARPAPARCSVQPQPSATEAELLGSAASLCIGTLRRTSNANGALDAFIARWLECRMRIVEIACRLLVDCGQAGAATQASAGDRPHSDGPNRLPSAAPPYGEPTSVYRASEPTVAVLAALAAAFEPPRFAHGGERRDCADSPIEGNSQAALAARDEVKARLHGCEVLLACQAADVQSTDAPTRCIATTHTALWRAIAALTAPLCTLQPPNGAESQRVALGSLSAACRMLDRADLRDALLDGPRRSGLNCLGGDQGADAIRCGAAGLALLRSLESALSCIAADRSLAVDSVRQAVQSVLALCQMADLGSLDLMVCVIRVAFHRAAFVHDELHAELELSPLWPAVHHIPRLGVQILLHIWPLLHEFPLALRRLCAPLASLIRYRGIDAARDPGDLDLEALDGGNAYGGFPGAQLQAGAWATAALMDRSLVLRVTACSCLLHLARTGSAVAVEAVCDVLLALLQTPPDVKALPPGSSGDAALGIWQAIAALSVLVQPSTPASAAVVAGVAGALLDAVWTHIREARRIIASRSCCA